MTRFVWLLVCLAAVGAAPAEAANRTVCRSGCAYTSLQTAIDEAAPGDVLLLRAGETFTGHVVLRAKSGSQYITIRSDAPDAQLPAAGVRLVPLGKPGGNTDIRRLPRLLGSGGTLKSTPVIRTEPGAHHYRLQFLDIDGAANVGYETLVQLGENTSKQTTASASPYALILDRVYIHGHPQKGMKRGVALDSRDTEVINSYFSDFMSLADSQAIGAFNGAGPFRIENNYLEAAGENILLGGSDPKIQNLVPSDVQIRRNHFFKPLAWRNPAMKAPSSVSVTAGGGGALAAGMHYFKVVAVMDSGGASLVSAPSTEVAVSVSSNGSVGLSWSSVSGADRYRVYRGTSSGGQTAYVDSTTTSLTYTGASQKSGTPASAGTRWTAKNLLELKNSRRVTVDGNLFENNWDGFQQGYAIVFTPRNQENTAPWTVVRDVTFTNNTVRNVSSAINILGEDYTHPSQPSTNFTIRNNLFVIDTAMGGKGYFITLTSKPSNITIDRNTIINPFTIVNVAGPAISGFVFTNNLSRHNTYGVQGQGYATGTSTLNHYFPGHVFRGNVLAGGKASNYPANNYFPTVAEFEAAFVNYGGGDYRLRPGAVLGGAPLQIGADILALLGAQGGDDEDPGEDDGGSTPPDNPPAQALPAGWSTQDIGTTGLQGNTGYASNAFTVAGAGADIWGSADGFRFAWRSLAGDGTIVARVASLSGSDLWTKAGVMIRASTAAGSAHAAMFVSKGKGLAFQRRAATNGTSVHTAGASKTAPYWVRLSRAGQVFTAAVSADGQTWTTVGSETIAMPETVLAGLAVTSHDLSALGTARFEQVSVSSGALPAGWRTDDVGAVGKAGSGSSASGVFTVKGAGADVWGAADAFHFTSTTLDGDGDIVARVSSLTGTDPWTKVGVMMRSTRDAGAPHAFMLISKEKGAAFQRRTVAGGNSTNTAGGSSTAPRWVKLSRRGVVITAFVSADGSAWTTVGSDTFSIGGTLQVGLAVSSHIAGTLATGTFDNVRVSGF